MSEIISFFPLLKSKDFLLPLLGTESLLSPLCLSSVEFDSVAFEEKLN